MFIVDHLALAEIQFLNNNGLLEFFLDHLKFFVDYAEKRIGQKEVFGFFWPEPSCFFQNPLANKMRGL
jgi:hypothetical protein